MKADNSQPASQALTCIDRMGDAVAPQPSVCGTTLGGVGAGGEKPHKLHVWVCGHYCGTYDFATAEEADDDNEYRKRFRVLGCHYQRESPIISPVEGAVGLETSHRKRKSPIDPKLSDGGGWRGPCMAGGKAAAQARAVTAVAVRCSAWLGRGVRVIVVLLLRGL